MSICWLLHISVAFLTVLYDFLFLLHILMPGMDKIWINDKGVDFTAHLKVKII